LNYLFWYRYSVARSPLERELWGLQPGSERGHQRTRLSVNIAGCFGVPGCGPTIANCPYADADFNGVMYITDLVRNINAAIWGCPAP